MANNCVRTPVIINLLPNECPIYTKPDVFARQKYVRPSGTKSLKDIAKQVAFSCQRKNIVRRCVPSFCIACVDISFSGECIS